MPSTTMLYIYYVYVLCILAYYVDWREIFMNQSVGKCKQINF